MTIAAIALAGTYAIVTALVALVNIGGWVDSGASAARFRDRHLGLATAARAEQIEHARKVRTAWLWPLRAARGMRNLLNDGGAQ